MHKRFIKSLPKPDPSLSSTDGAKPAVSGRPVASSAVSSSSRHRLLDKSASLAKKPPAQRQGKLKGVNRGASGDADAEDDELRGRGRSSAREVDQEEGEFDYDEEFADDEEGIAVVDDLADEQEAKELEVRTSSSSPPTSF